VYGQHSVAVCHITARCRCRAKLLPRLQHATRACHGRLALLHHTVTPRQLRIAITRAHLMRTSILWIQPRLFVGVGVRLVFGLQESAYLQQSPHLHMDSNLGVILLHGKIIKSTLRHIQPHVDILSESITITDFIQRYILSMVSLFLYAFIDDSENRLLPNNVMMIRNYGEDTEGIKERCGGAKEQQRRPSQVGVPIQVELESNLNFRNSRHQNYRSDHIPTPFWTFFMWMES
jgi:hypothetical protein